MQSNETQGKEQENQSEEKKKGLLRRPIKIWKLTLPLWLVAIGGCCILSLGIYAISGGEVAEAPDTSTVSEPADTSEEAASEPTDAPEPTNTPIPLADSYEEMTAAAEDMTDAQWKAYQDDQEGKRIDGWTGWVSDVNEKFLGGYELWVDLDSPEAILSVQDVYFDIGEDRALEVSKEEKVRFSGVVEGVTRTMGTVSIRLEEATWEIIE